MHVTRFEEPEHSDKLAPMVSAYEQELHAVEPRFKPGLLATYMDVPGMRVFGIWDGGKLAGFFVVEEKENEAELHDFFVRPEYRSGKAFAGGVRHVLKTFAGRVTFNVFTSHERMQKLAGTWLGKRRIRYDVSDGELNGIPCLRFVVRAARRGK